MHTPQIQSDILGYLKTHENKAMLRFITCGSVDDGKSTLIGRLLHDTKMIFEDQLEAITKESKKVGTTGERVDLALLVDGLQSEREQGITIDVAYRYFTTDKRKFIIADTPGHEQYTRNMATGASTADAAIILIDARHGIQTQTRRHSYITRLLGITHTIVAINKMDLVEYAQEVFERIKAEYVHFAGEIGIKDVVFIPLSALEGDNVASKSLAMPWYEGESLLETLETIPEAQEAQAPFRFPVQWVNRPHLNFRGFSGSVASGTVHVGDSVRVLPSNRTSKIASIVTYDGEQESAKAPMAVTVTLEDEIDIGRGDVLVHAHDVPELCTAFEATLVWMSDAPLRLGMPYALKMNAKTVDGFVEEVLFRKDVNTQEEHPAQTLGLNDIGRAKVVLSSGVLCDTYEANRNTGRFIIIERYTNKTVGVGMIVGKAKSVQQVHHVSEYEKELNAFVRKHFPHWEAKDVSVREDFTI